MINIIFRVKRDDGNYIGCSAKSHGERDICVFNKKMQVLRDADIKELMRTMSHYSQNLEVGLWSVNDDENTLTKVISFLQWKRAMIDKIP